MSSKDTIAAAAAAAIAKLQARFGGGAAATAAPPSALSAPASVGHPVAAPMAWAMSSATAPPTLLPAISAPFLPAVALPPLPPPDTGEWPLPEGGFKTHDDWPPATDLNKGARVRALQRAPGFYRHDIIFQKKEALKKLIGTGGEHHKAIQSRTGATMFILGEEPPPNEPADARMVVLLGAASQVAHATLEVMAAVNGPGRGAADITALSPGDLIAIAAATDPGEPPVPPSHVRGAWLFPGAVMGLVLGRGGANLNKLREQTGCVIKIIEKPPQVCMLPLATDATTSPHPNYPSPCRPHRPRCPRRLRRRGGGAAASGHSSTTTTVYCHHRRLSSAGGLSTRSRRDLGAACLDPHP